jgi:hypothetical protein
MMNDQKNVTNINEKRVPTNVIDIGTGQPLMPRQMRKAIIRQYAESKGMNESPEDFATNLEKRLITELTYAGAQFIKGFFEEMKNDESN